MTKMAFFSDVHGNLAALRAVLADIAAKDVDSSRIFSLGDLVGYGPDPNGVIDLIREAGISSLLGNYDDGVGFERGECGCFYPSAHAKRIGEASYDFTVRVVTQDRKAYLQTLPREIRLEAAGRRLHLVHGSPRRLNEYLLRDRDERTYHRLAASEDAAVLLFGHTHDPWHRTYDGVLFVNVGSAGWPKDGDPRPCYTILDLSPEEIRVEVIRVAYDVEETVAAMFALGLPPALARSLRQGMA